MSGNKTSAAPGSVDEFLSNVEPAPRREDARALDGIFRKATGFSPRKADLTVYILPGYADFGEIPKDLGPHRLGKSCLYLKRLDDVDGEVLVRLIRAGLADLGRYRPVMPR